MDLTSMMPWVWAQSAAPDPTAVPLLALRRWFASQTLSSPEAMPSRTALVAWAAGLGALLVLAAIAQGPGRALRQLIDLPGQVRLWSAAVGRLRRAGRLVAVLLGATVLAWTAAQSVSYRSEDRLKDLDNLLRTKSLREVAVEQGMLAGLSPMRDLFALGDNLLLLIGAATLVFKLSADRWGGSIRLEPEPRAPAPGWTTLCWGSAWLYVMYRLAAMVAGEPGMPLGGCLFVEAGIIPTLMALADGLLLAWVLVELRAAEPEEVGGEGFDVMGTVAMVPAATAACLAALPARYVATAAWLLYFDVQGLGTNRAMSVLLRGWGLVDLQAAALLTVGLAGGAAWCSGGVGEAMRGYGRLLRAEGGRLVGLLAATGLLCGGLAAVAYALVLALPRQPWVLSAADSYAHYATLPVGLVGLAGLVELGARAREVAGPVGAVVPAEEAMA